MNPIPVTFRHVWRVPEHRNASFWRFSACITVRSGAMLVDVTDNTRKFWTRAAAERHAAMLNRRTPPWPE